MIASIVVIAVVAARCSPTPADSGKNEDRQHQDDDHAARDATTALKLAVGTVNVQNTGPPTKVKPSRYVAR